MVTITTDGITIEAENLTKARAALRKAMKDRDQKEAMQRQKYENAQLEANRNSLWMFRKYFNQTMPSSWQTGAPGELSCLEKLPGELLVRIHQGSGAVAVGESLGVISGIESSSGIIAIKCCPMDSLPQYLAVGICDDEIALNHMPDIVGELLWKLTAEKNCPEVKETAGQSDPE
jgi:hypothetical protein